MAMTASGIVEVQLQGGELDGDTIRMAANGSVTVPGQLIYVGRHGAEACWLIYGVGQLGFSYDWPLAREIDGEEVITRHVYQFFGKYSFDFSRKLA